MLVSSIFRISKQIIHWLKNSPISQMSFLSQQKNVWAFFVVDIDCSEKSARHYKSCAALNDANDNNQMVVVHTSQLCPNPIGNHSFAIHRKEINDSGCSKRYYILLSNYLWMNCVCRVFSSHMYAKKWMCMVETREMASFPNST